MRNLFLVVAFNIVLIPYSWAQEDASNPQRPRREPARSGFGGPIELGPDDQQVYEDPPASIIEQREGIAHGKLEMIEYESKTVLSCGNKDGLIRVSQQLQRYLKENDVPHTWNVDSHGHDATHWRNNLYHYVQRLFQED